MLVKEFLIVAVYAGLFLGVKVNVKRLTVLAGFPSSQFFVRDHYHSPLFMVLGLFDLPMKGGTITFFKDKKLRAVMIKCPMLLVLQTFL